MQTITFQIAQPNINLIVAGLVLLILGVIFHRQAFKLHERHCDTAHHYGWAWGFFAALEYVGGVLLLIHGILWNVHS